ncbi:MAG: PAS domain S-box protein [Deltaproteobacteria bacterium]|nr:PAS domain S-box protein [Deltaproteobacteria bacterium]
MSQQKDGKTAKKAGSNGYSGEVVGFEGSPKDDFIQRQAALLREQAELLDLAEDIIMVLDPEHRILFWNRGAEEKYGWPKEEAMGQPAQILLQTQFPKPMAEVDADLLLHGRWDGELIHTRRDGAQLNVESRWAVHMGQKVGSFVILCINNDITKRKNAEEMLQKTLQELEVRVQKRTEDLTKANADLEAEIIERKRTEEVLRQREAELEIKSRNMEEMNGALKVLLKKREEDRVELGENVLANIKEMVVPYLDKLRRSSLDADQVNYLNIIETHLQEITSPFLKNITSRHWNLTPREFQVASLIKDNKTTKEIAELMNVCAGSVELHRNHIRAKLGLTNKKINLRSYLLTLQ